MGRYRAFGWIPWCHREWKMPAATRVLQAQQVQAQIGFLVLGVPPQRILVPLGRLVPLALALAELQPVEVWGQVCPARGQEAVVSWDHNTHSQPRAAWGAVTLAVWCAEEEE
jgi:hypothetical protein